MSYQRLYPQRINWEDEPSLATPINQVNLNKMDSALFGIDGRVVELDENKVGKSDTFNTSRNGVVPKPTQADITNEKVLRADGVWVEQSGGGGGGGGHTIVNNAGTSLTQRSKLKTVGGLNATDDGVNNTTEITDVVEEVPWTTWQSYPSEEAALQAHPNCVVTGAPDCDGDIEIENLHLAWSNPSPTSVFAGQIVPLDTETDWDFVRVYISYSNSNPSKNMPFVEMEKGTGGQANCASSSTYGVAAIYRNIAVDDDTHISFGECAVKDMSQSAVELNQFLIPIKIYTYKKKLTAKIQAIARNVSTEASKCMLDENTSVEDAINNSGYTVTANSSLGSITYSQIAKLNNKLLIDVVFASTANSTSGQAIFSIKKDGNAISCIAQNVFGQRLQNDGNSAYCPVTATGVVSAGPSYPIASSKIYHFNFILNLS